MNKTGWKQVKLGEICSGESSNVSQNKIQHLMGNYPIFGASGYIQNIDFYKQDKEYIGVVKDGAGVGRVMRLPAESSILGTLQYIIPNKGTDINFLFYLLGKLKLDRYASGATIPHIYYRDYSNEKVLLPPFETQRHIAATLDKANELIALRKKQLEELDALAESVFYELFGDPVKNEKRWEKLTLSQFYKNGNSAIKCGPFGSALKKEEYTSFGIPVWNMDNISKNGKFDSSVNLWINTQKYKELESYNVIDGDIIISRAGTVGKMCVVKSQYPQSIISTNLIRLRLNDKLLPLFFVFLMTCYGNKICRLKVGEDGAFTHMNTGVLNSIIFPYPPLSLQVRFATIIEKIEEQKTLVRQALKESEDLFQRLMEDLFHPK
ncbi:restriction endonuclease subunit S [Bacteroides sp. UBA939]|uniref:restriction endonuclease subunit S n=1 Tax=Bacteroides sp. UBA939 TaxID=1946092 RepID=UPI0025B977FC|nr:restriction endonuclease subunit S [Bacteroides sp. UBA939]